MSQFVLGVFSVSAVNRYYARVLCSKYRLLSILSLGSQSMKLVPKLLPLGALLARRQINFQAHDTEILGSKGHLTLQYFT